MFGYTYLPHRGVIWIKRQWLRNLENKKPYASAKQTISGYAQENPSMAFQRNGTPTLKKTKLQSTPVMFNLL